MKSVPHIPFLFLFYDLKVALVMLEDKLLNLVWGYCYKILILPLQILYIHQQRG